MEYNITIDVNSLDSAHRRAFEDVIGVELQPSQRLVIGVENARQDEQSPAAPSIEDWAKVYEGLSAKEVEEIDLIINTRANLTRDID